MEINNKSMAGWIDGYVTSELIENDIAPTVFKITMNMSAKLNLNITKKEMPSYTRFIVFVKKNAQKRYRRRKQMAKRIVKQICRKFKRAEPNYHFFEQIVLRHLMSERFDLVSNQQMKGIEELCKDMLMLPLLIPGQSKVPIDCKKEIII